PLATSYPSPTSEASSGEGRRAGVGVLKNHAHRRQSLAPPPDRRFAPATLPTRSAGEDGRERAITARALSKRPIASVHRAAAGFFQEFVDQGLADPRGHLLVDRHHGLAHRRILLLCQVKELGLAGLLDVRERVVVLPGRLAVAVFGGF